jgi:hypothetical protein
MSAIQTYLLVAPIAMAVLGAGVALWWTGRHA